MRAFLACLLAACAAPPTPRPQQPLPTPVAEDGWAILLPGDVAARDVAFDGDGNVYVTGSFRFEIDLGPGPVEALGGRDGFLASYDASGAHRWSRRFGDGGADSGLALATSEREVAVLAMVDQAAELGGGLVRFRPGFSAQTRVTFLARYQRDGAYVGFTTLDEQGPSQFEAVAATESGGFLVAGSGQGEVTTPGAEVGRGVLRVAGIGATGWRHHFGYGFSEQTSAGVTPHGDGALLAIRVERGLEGVEGPSLAWMNVDAAGATLRRVLGPGRVLAQEPAPGEDGALVLLELTADTELGPTGTMLASLSPDGTARWVSPIPGARDLAVRDGRVVVVANHARELHVHEVDPTNGQVASPVRVATAATGARIALGDDGAIALVAQYEEEAELDGLRLGGTGSFLVKLSGLRSELRSERVEEPRPAGPPTAGADEVAQARAVDDALDGLYERLDEERDDEEAAPSLSTAEQALVEALREATDRQYGQTVVSHSFGVLNGPDGPVVVHSFGHGRWRAWVEGLRRRGRLDSTIARAERIREGCIAEHRLRMAEADRTATALEAVAERTGTEADQEAAYVARDLVDEIDREMYGECADVGWRDVYAGESRDRICDIDTRTVEVRAVEGPPERPRVGRVLGSRSIDVCIVGEAGPDTMQTLEPLPAERDAPTRIRVGDVDGDDLPEAVVYVSNLQPIGDVGRNDFSHTVVSRHLWVFRHDGEAEVALEEDAPEQEFRTESTRASSLVRWRAEDVNADGRADLVRERLQLRRVCGCGEVLAQARAEPTPIELIVEECGGSAEISGGCLPLGPPERTVRLYDPATDSFGEPH